MPLASESIVTQTAIHSLPFPPLLSTLRWTEQQIFFSPITAPDSPPDLTL